MHGNELAQVAALDLAFGQHGFPYDLMWLCHYRQQGNNSMREAAPLFGAISRIGQALFSGRRCAP
jgi:hypothetical protein